jgi:hypothetical protein
MAEILVARGLVKYEAGLVYDVEKASVQNWVIFFEKGK